MKTSLERIATMLAACALALGMSACSGSGKPDGGDDDGGVTDAGRDAGRRDAGPDGGQPDGSTVDTDGGTDGGSDCVANPHTPAEIANRCTNSFRIPVNRTPPCAGGAVLPAPGSDLPGDCLLPDAGVVNLPDGSTCYFPN